MTVPAEDIDDSNDVFSEQLSVESENIMAQTQDPHAMGENITECSAFMNVIKANVGTGILTMPMVFNYVGIWLGLVMILSAGFLATYCMKLLLVVSNEVSEENELDQAKMDYTETVFNVFKYGPRPLRKPKGKIKHTVNAFLIVTQIGFCCVYILFLSQTIQTMLKEWAPHLNRSTFLIGFVVSLVLTPFTMITDLSKFSIPATMANVATLIALLLIFIYCLVVGEMKPWQELQQPMGFRQFLIAFSIVIFAFEGISLVLPIRNKMKHPEFFLRRNGSLYMGMFLVCSTCTLLGWFGYFRFGKDIEPSIAYNIPESPIWVAFVKPLLVFYILVTYILQFYVPASIFGRLMEKIPRHRNADPAIKKWNLRIMRIASVYLIYGLAMIIPHLDLLLSLIGALCSSVLAIILPPMLVLVHKWPSRHVIDKFNLRYLFPMTALIVIGILAFVGGTVATIMQLIDVYSPTYTE
ncbi:hypothetical protein Ciccas_010301 [Cichlidogyrus casuarinus]|uniref:Amino acid transporter transmembrane domain-containing protein n=1 Tax=Cichlidogyrus casuarinus TaxID=1844966 RepID=A0ABD2PV33_9PLAT